MNIVIWLLVGYLGSGGPLGRDADPSLRSNGVLPE
jgi:hypothetical protein